MSSGGAASLKTQLGALRDVPEESRKDRALALCRPWLAQERERLKTRFYAKADAAALVAGHAAMMDKLLEGLYASSRDKKSKTLPLSVVAIGGYGRGELFPYSDIDILFLYDEAHASEAARIAESILYVLWDLGLKVGHAHRSVEEALTLAQKDFTIRTSLLDARLLAGSAPLFEAFSHAFAAQIAEEGSALEFVEAKLAERDTRHQRFGDSRYMLEPNVKEGKGGLRDLQTLWWLARYAYPIATFKDLVKMNLLSAEEYKNFDHARQFLWTVRAWLHYISGHAEDRLTFDRQQAVAVHMGFEHTSINRTIERFMRRYFVAVRTVGTMTRIFCALLEEEKKRKPRYPTVWSWSGAWGISPFKMDGERLNVRNEDAFEREPALMLELFRLAQDNELIFTRARCAILARTCI